MSIRLFLTPFALAGALLGGCVAAFAQPAPAPAQQAAPQQQQGPGDAPGGQAPDGAPQQQPPPRRHGAMRAALATLDLSPDQRGQIKNFMKSYRASQQTNAPMTHKQLMEQIRGVLSPDQQSQFRAALRAQKQQQAQGQDPNQGPGGNDPGQGQPQQDGQPAPQPQ